MAHKTYIVGIGGLTQGYGTRHGMIKLDMKLQKLRSPLVSVEYYPWYAPFPDIAERIAMETEEWENVRIVAFCFSYGGGWGFLQLARELGKRDLNIETAVLCDAVYRSRWFIGKWLAFVDWPMIRVPDNVCRVIPFVQRMSRPRGHRIVAINEKTTTIEEPIILHASHVNCDDNRHFHAVAIDVAEKAILESAIEEVVTKQADADQGVQPQISLED